MDVMEVANTLVAFCKEGKFQEAIEELYADDIVSIEGASAPGMDQRMEGIDAVRGKNQWWVENHEVHSSEVSGPYVAEGADHFAVHFALDVTSKMDGNRQQMSEVALYTVRDGKIAQEQFLFHMG